MITEKNYFPMPDTSKDPNSRGSSQVLMQLEEIDPGAMVAGIVAVDVDSLFGKGLGTVYGCVLLDTIGADNEILGASVATHASTAGKLTITIHSNSGSSTLNLPATTKVLIYGKITPKAYS